MSTENEKIEEYIEKFFEENTTDKVWELFHTLCVQFGLSSVEVYNYVSKYLSKKWEVDKLK